MEKIRMLFVTLPLLLVISGQAGAEQKIEGRWYTPSQVNSGRTLFAKHCAACHGDNAEGTTDWKKTLADGSYPPPPLNGTAHTWHHPLQVLKKTINNGGLAWGGKMPPFKDKLTEPEKNNIVAFFQSKWSKKIYTIWIKRGGLK